ncbi:sensor histidine kinase [Phenylobacterium sp. J367]|uniref:sensor histidine kinase n=1 Tax=Phenylobacterium sp. J367 TaxID=2898435 RepID=UPI002151DCF3|nr:histidine kinase dimerization/phosphoacceptor domain -containing protein [Phenylobacterium sp. J367]MCR5879419.1 ATP-binding protein [Phenylobacterium sp. J367]
MLRGALAQALTLALLALAALVRARLGAVFPGLTAFSLFYPVIMAAALAGGWPAAATALAGGGLLGGWFMLEPVGAASPIPAHVAVNLGLYAFAGACIAAGGLYLRALLARQRANTLRLAERELRYRTLFDTVSEGFALLQAVRGADGRLVDYQVLEANPAILRLLGLDASVIGRRQSELTPRASEAWLQACGRALDGIPVSVEYQSPATGRWYQIRLSRVMAEQFAQVVQDITDQKAAEAHQAEMFDELNHRVKNNLAMVSSLLNMQARGASAEVSTQLQRAVGRIHAISDVHASLCRSGRKDDVDLAAYLGDLCRRLEGSVIENERVRITLAAEPAILAVDRAVALGVVVNELITNAAKHAYPAPASGEIAVRLSRTDHTLVLSVTDHGPGLPDPPGAGLGMRLVRSMVQQIGGDLEVEGGPGAVFRVRLPDAPAGPFAAAPPQGRLL